MKVADEILIEEHAIEKRINRIADEINKDFQKNHPLVLAVLNGAYIFSADITRRLKIPYSLGFVGIKSTSGAETGKIRQVNYFTDEDFNGRDIIILDDIYDSGETLSFLRNDLLARGAENIKACLFCRKEHPRPRKEVEIDYLGFTLPDKWVIGYGMDFNGKYRGLPYVTYIEHD